VPVLVLEELALGLGDAEGALVTVTIADLTAFFAEFPLPAVTVAVNVILSPGGADFGMTTWVSAFGVAGSLVGSEKVQLVLLAQPPTVNVG
jgi:hypothetical protein